METLEKPASASHNVPFQVICKTPEEPQEPVILDFYLGVVTKCPPGVAAGSNYLRSRGNTAWPEITYWPETHQYALDDGTGKAHPIIRVRGIRMWNQEIAVYLTERKKSIGAMIEELGLASLLPRIGGIDNALEPVAEDFHLFADPWRCCRCDFTWERRKGQAPAEYCPHCYCGWWQHPKKSKKAVAE